MSNYIHYKVEWNYLSIPNDATMEVWEWMSNFISNFTEMWLLIHFRIQVNAC